MFIEEYLDILLGFAGNTDYDINKSDYGLLLSIRNQLYKNIGLTDRQLILIQEKLNLYSSQLEENGYTNLDFSQSKLPIREIDRSRWIKIIDDKIAVRFIFNKKLISVLEELRMQGLDSDYDKQEKIHFYKYNESNLFKIVNSLRDRNFVLSDEVLSIYEKLEEMNNNKKDYIPGVYNYQLKNLKQKTIDIIISSMGEPNKDNLALYKDRRLQLGLHHFDESDLNESSFNLTTLTKKVISRNKSQLLIKPSMYTLDNVIETVLELHRFPLLVIVNEKLALDTIIECQKRFNNIISNESITTMFRKDNDNEGKIFNEYIKNKHLNNSLDNSTKVVYITNNKIPKPLLKSGWQPSAVLSFDSTRANPKIATYLGEFDLVMYYDNEPSYMLRNYIEKI